MSTPPPELPRLPIPDLRKTMEKYLQSIQPLLLYDEANGGAPFSQSYAHQQSLVESFLTFPGPLAQARLKALDEVSPHNWLDDNFWMKKTYLEWRAPLLINSNWWLTFLNDPDVPEVAVRDEGEGLTPWQVRRAACLVHGILDFKHRMDSQELHPETTRTGVWLRHCTSLIFNRSRVPLPHCDALTPPAPCSSQWSSTITVLAHDFFYALRVTDPLTGAPLHVDKIERGLRDVVRDVLRRKGKGEKALEVGVLSSDGRDAWAESYATLISVSPQNARTFDALHHSQFALCLDHWPAPSVPADKRDESLPLTFGNGRDPASCATSFSPSPSHNQTPSDLSVHQSRIRSSVCALNRFFDKPLSLIVERTTRAGAMGEHACVDALIPSVVCERAVAGCGGAKNERDTKLDASAQWSRLYFIPASSTVAAIENAKARADAAIQNSDHEVLYFDEFGGEDVRSFSSYPPDPFVQLALQLAYFRLQGHPTAVYETALTRSFKHGRTETIRSFTKEAWIFLQEARRECARNAAMQPAQTLYSFLLAALRSHSSLTRSAMTGRGIDRHLLGLRCILGEEWEWLDTDEIKESMSWRPGNPVPLFDDAVFRRSMEWRLSTSGLSEGWLFRGTGFGSPYEDGYGVNYLIRPNSIKFCIESKHSCPTTSTHAFVAQIVEALRDMRDICLWAKRQEDKCYTTGTGMGEDVKIFKVSKSRKDGKHISDVNSANAKARL
ncbi:acyltransferase ChoActase/COT/CPT [Phlebopus sp. FC_14]|nr:acyltransferase ChoActase/COT/CPT [Phlebopus sp. FC_14]